MKLHLFHNSFDFVPRTLIGMCQYKNCICHHLCNRGLLLLVLGIVLSSSNYWENLKRNNDEPQKIEYSDSDRSIHASKFGVSKEGIQDYFTFGFAIGGPPYSFWPLS